MLGPLHARFWRMLNLRWQREPLSGAGAAKMGGRWNRVGQEALYLSRNHGVAVAEFHQTLVRPGTLVAYDVASDAIADLTDKTFITKHFPTLDEDEVVNCEWRKIWKLENREPPTWALVDALRSEGAVGALVPSVQQRGGVNLVLWEWSDKSGADAHVRVIDPESELAG